jgi:hypothetical protein
VTKIQERRKARYLKQLRKCGFRSWKQANIARFALIRQKFEKGLADSETADLAELQKLCGLWQDYKTNDALGRSSRRLKRIHDKLVPRP